VLNSGADVLILNHYGFDGVNSLTQAVQFGMRDKQVNGKKFEIVLPLVSDLMAKGAGTAIQDVYGTGNWDWQLTDDASKAFTKSFGAKYGQPPSQIAHTSYVQALLYADAVERAGTFYPPEVIKALEDFDFDGMGNGPTTYRGADHQCFKEVYVVKGKEKPANPFDLLEVVDTASKESTTYDPTMFGGELGPYDPAMCA
jgi:branched-chain amino acid transport system substrate-binding protein